MDNRSAYRILKKMSGITKSQEKINKSVTKILKRQNRAILLCGFAILTTEVIMACQECRILYLKSELEKMRDRKESEEMYD